jgi:hypothetical protein
LRTWPSATGWQRRPQLRRADAALYCGRAESALNCGWPKRPQL